LVGWQEELAVKSVVRSHRFEENRYAFFYAPSGIFYRLFFVPMMMCLAVG
jgi:hypothetical protein